jgi:hypothetical protein
LAALFAFGDEIKDLFGEVVFWFYLLGEVVGVDRLGLVDFEREVEFLAPLLGHPFQHTRA